MLKSLMEAWPPHVWVNVHSGMEALFMPFDHKAMEPTVRTAQKTKQTTNNDLVPSLI